MAMAQTAFRARPTLYRGHTMAEIRLTSELPDMFAKSHELEDGIRRKLGAIVYEI